MDLDAQLQDGLAPQYAIERELGRGGMATVYLALDRKHHHPVALKVLHAELAQSLETERFLREIEFCARLQHPHILTVLDSGETAGRLWFTMPYVEGESLRARLERETQLPVEEALQIAREAADALDYAHRHGVIHRDIKPENILISGGHALVADFGIGKALGGAPAGARITATGLVVGTPACMSPEQASGEHEMDARTDLYSLGTVLYEMLAGEPPFAGPTVQAVILRRFSGEVPSVRRARPSVPDAVDRAVTCAPAGSGLVRVARAQRTDRDRRALRLAALAQRRRRTGQSPADRRSSVPESGRYRTRVLRAGDGAGPRLRPGLGPSLQRTIAALLQQHAVPVRSGGGPPDSRAGARAGTRSPRGAPGVGKVLHRRRRGLLTGCNGIRGRLANFARQFGAPRLRCQKPRKPGPVERGTGD